ncbi:ATP-dependent DNA helicase [Haliscomenobacter hydrossis]|uniref:AAA ATPase n=1 Tax=Haliscomenobacter hydrossis (strain ATCC 27775 / DSM 1100 / LMG 10767 / O) TaxID=760192 RepID=F4L5Z0_HALH1|nr:AAA family ATPase [Haliscomenobacter hydrossis]AEE53050.1 AAA ATPase [Haliscomenobacter hydrossis DSM 1100]
MKALELNSDFKTALDLIEKESKNLFITGRAGTGKSTLLQLFRNTTRKKAVVLAPTGVAALNVRGQTIHSFFGFPPRLISPREISKRKERRLYRNMEVLVIDEISMVRADVLDNIDYFLRLNRDSPLPFGGVQVVFFGDLFQLPPVVATDFEQEVFSTTYDSAFFFSAQVFKSGFELEMMELRKVYRQDNRHFLRLLDGIRLNHADQDDLDELNERFDPHFESVDFYITLSARNATADRINQRELSKIDLPERKYLATVTGEFNPTLYPAEAVLNLKLGAQVMLLKNDPDRRYVNGTIGKIVALENETLKILIEDGFGDLKEIEVAPVTWEIIRYKNDLAQTEDIQTEVIGTFTQFPLRLAWAVTIHKAQGKTFDRVIIDLGAGAFEHGQTYVALSRCRTLEGIVLRQRIRPQDVLTDMRILDFYQLMRGR